MPSTATVAPPAPIASRPPWNYAAGQENTILHAWWPDGGAACSVALREATTGRRCLREGVRSCRRCRWLESLCERSDIYAEPLAACGIPGCECHLAGDAP